MHRHCRNHHRFISPVSSCCATSSSSSSSSAAAATAAATATSKRKRILRRNDGLCSHHHRSYSNSSLLFHNNNHNQNYHHPITNSATLLPWRSFPRPEMTSLRRLKTTTTSSTAAAAAATATANPRRNMFHNEYYHHSSSDERNTNHNNKHRHKKEWHDPSFMVGSSTVEKESWLESLLAEEERLQEQQQRQYLDESLSSSSSSSSSVVVAAAEETLLRQYQSPIIVDVEAFLVVLRDLAGGTTEDHQSSSSSSSSSLLSVFAPKQSQSAFFNTDHVYKISNPRRAEYWIQRMKNLINAAPNHQQQVQLQLQPTSECYECVIRAWANASDKEEIMVVVNRSERWFHEMIHQSSLSSTFLGSLLISSSSSPQDEDAYDQQLQQIWHSHSPPPPNDDQHSTTTTFEPTIECVNAYLDACTRGRQGKSKLHQQTLDTNAQRAEAILRRLVALAYYHYHNESSSSSSLLPLSLYPTTTTFNYVIRGISRCKHDDTIHDRILGLVRMMEGFQRRRAALSSSTDDITTNDIDNAVPSELPRPNTKTYSMTMDALISVAKLKARKYHHYRTYHRDDRNNDSHYDDDTQPIINSGLQEMEEATAILTYMHDLYDAGIPDVIPHRVPYNILITGWAALASFNSVGGGDGGGGGGNHRRGDDRSGDDYHSTNDDSDNNVTWYRDSAPFKAEEILRIMMANNNDANVDRYQQTSSSSGTFFDMMIGDEGSPKAIGRQGGVDMGGTETGKSSGSSSSGQHLLSRRRCPDATPDRISFEKVIQAWLNSGHPNAGKRAMWWLKQLWIETQVAEQQEKQNDDGGSDYANSSGTKSNSYADLLRPTTSTYNIVMRALAASSSSSSTSSYSMDYGAENNIDSWDSALAAENLLLDLGEKYRNDGNPPELRPNSESFSIVIRAWLRATHDARGVVNQADCLKRAAEWLSSLREVENENDLSTAPELFLGVLKAASRCARGRPEEVMALATEIFETLRTSRYQVSDTSYRMMLQVGLQCYSRPGSEGEREQFLNKLIEDCFEDGLVNSVLVRTIVNHPSYECQSITHKYFQHWPLPIAWSRNVKNALAMPSPLDLQIHYDRPSIRRRSTNARQRYEQKQQQQ